MDPDHPETASKLLNVLGDYDLGGPDHHFQMYCMAKRIGASTGLVQQVVNRFVNLSALTKRKKESTEALMMKDFDLPDILLNSAAHDDGLSSLISPPLVRMAAQNTNTFDHERPNVARAIWK